MAVEITMPQLGESVTEGTITRWLVEPGDEIKKYDPIAEVMTDKVNAEVPSSYTGTIKELIAEIDQTVEVGQVICTVDTGEEAPAEEKPTQEKSAPSAEQADVQQSAPKQEDVNKKSGGDDNSSRYSPAVMRLAQENKIDLQQVKGSGRGGRITRKDIEKRIREGAPAAEASPAQEAAPAEAQAPKQSGPAPESDSRREVIPVTGVRKAIAQNMVQSKQEAPHAWMMVEVDVTGLSRLRKRMKQEFEQQEGVKLTYMPFFMKAVVEALKKFPQVNATWENDHIIRHKDVHLSVAVASEEELFVPVIRHADEKNITGLARSLQDTAAKVRAGSLSSADMQGGTFTLNNTGSFGSVQSQPIINRPQAAILSVESIVKRPVVVDGDAIAVREMVNLCMSLDHRILDGAICGAFMNHIKQTLENISEDQMTL
ncbi:dihydrolipoamide acetyltransferase family protein [Alkalicoccus chagannorensis]|uniref:dihydrolipoamide acetyltransferase family protein n=1 Tax=Alkalicoccus chagannorensis TaxID=427072 RepID=UPI00041A81E8|nr:dihydrolipoamide acetyltransferase family protein [Alkalicoccus chagannorensis]